MPNISNKVMAVLRPIITVLIAFIIGIFLILPTGTSPVDAYRILFYGAFGNMNNILNTLGRSTPLLFSGLAAAFAFKGGVFNIGSEGQMHLGAFAAALVGIYGAGLPAIILIPLCLIGASIAAGLWSIIPGVFKNKYGINIVITSIMMNNIASLFTTYLASYPFKGELPIAATHKVAESAMLMRFSPRSELNIGFVIGIIIAIILYLIIFKTRFGYETRALGLNQRFTSYMGVDINKKSLLILTISAVIAGIGGAEQTLGVNYRFLSGFSPGYGFTGITVALLGGLNPFGVIIGAIFFGALTQGSVQMEVLTNISRDLISALQAIIILLLAAEGIIKFQIKKGKSKEGDA